MKPVLQRNARRLRHDQTDAEALLWRVLRSRQMMGHKFRRQVLLQGYIADFVCPKSRLVVEVDGGQHASRENCDAERTAYFADLGYRVLRFWNHEVLGEADAVIRRIESALSNPHPGPLPSEKGEGGNTE